jgi:hypothetical protein
VEVIMLSEKKLEKIEKNIGKETMAGIEAMPVDILKDTLVSAEHSIAEAQRELEANPQYQAAKELLKDITGSLRDVKKRQNSIIQYCLHILEEKGSK